MKSSCPECGFLLEVGEPVEGQRLTCPRCHARLEIVSLEPLELDWAYNEPSLMDLNELERL
jgi:lysine biosynthesis protein LysW